MKTRKFFREFLKIETIDVMEIGNRSKSFVFEFLCWQQRNSFFKKNFKRRKAKWARKRISEIGN